MLSETGGGDTAASGTGSLRVGAMTGVRASGRRTRMPAHGATHLLARSPCASMHGMAGMIAMPPVPSCSCGRRGRSTLPGLCGPSVMSGVGVDGRCGLCSGGRGDRQGDRSQNHLHRFSLQRVYEFAQVSGAIRGGGVSPSGRIPAIIASIIGLIDTASGCRGSPRCRSAAGRAAQTIAQPAPIGPECLPSAGAESAASQWPTADAAWAAPISSRSSPLPIPKGMRMSANATSNVANVRSMLPNR